jgi:hypothetical protein
MRLSFHTNNGVLGIRRGNVGVVAVFGTLIAGSDWSIASVGPCFRMGVDLNLRRTRWKGIVGWLKFVKSFVFLQRVGSVFERRFWFPRGFGDRVSFP